MKHSASVTPNNCRSGCKLRGIVEPFLTGNSSRCRFQIVRSRSVLQLRDQLLENAAAMLVVLKLVKTRTGRREQDDIASPRAVCRDFNGTLHRSSALRRHSVPELPCDLLCCCANKQHQPRALLQRFAKERV